MQLLKAIVDTQKASYRSIGAVNAYDDLQIVLNINMNDVPVQFVNPIFELISKKEDGNWIRQQVNISLTENNEIEIIGDIQLVTCTGIVSNQLIIDDNGRKSTCIFHFQVRESLDRQIIQSISNVKVLEELDTYVVQAFENLREFEERIEAGDATIRKLNDDMIAAETNRENAEADRGSTFDNLVTRMNNVINVAITTDETLNNNETARINNFNTLKTELEQIREGLLNLNNSISLDEQNRVQAELDRANASIEAINRLNTINTNITNEEATRVQEWNNIKSENTTLKEALTTINNTANSNEEVRKKKEEERIAAEQQRQANFETMQQENNSFKERIDAQYDNIASEFDKAVANVTNGNENATNSEIVQARGKEVNLNARLTKFDSQLENKANKNEVVQKGYATLNDFNEETRRVIQGIDQGNINAVLGDGNVLLNNLSNEIVDSELGNNLITGTQSLTYTDGSASYTYNCTNFIEVTEANTNFALNFTYHYLLVFDMDENFMYQSSLAGLTNFKVGDANRKFVLTEKNKTRIFSREKDIVIKGTSISAYVPDKRTLKSTILPMLNSDNIENNSISMEKLDSSFTEIEKGTNLYKKDEALTNYTIVNSEGATVTTGNFSNWIKTTPGEIYCSSQYYTQFYFFDEVDGEKVFKGQTTILANPAVFTATGDYVLIRCDKGEHQVVLGSNLNNVTEDKVIINKNILPSTIEGGYTSRWKGKKWIVLGDSISVLSPKNYHDFVGADLGMIVNNLAVSGRTMLDGINLVNSESMPSEYDLVTVFYGANDQGYNCSIGSFDDGADYTTNLSFYSRVQEMIRLLKAKNPNAQIAFFTPIRRSVSGEGYQEYLVNAVGKTTKDYGDVIKDCCEKLGVHCLDLYQYGVDPRESAIRDRYFLPNENGIHTDGTHLNPLGQATFIAPKVRDFLEKIAPYELI